MFGKIDLIHLGILVVSTGAFLTDLVWARIFNRWTVPAALIGFAVSTWCFGWTGLGESSLGFIAGFLVYSWMFYFKVLGGGDVKLMMALGAWGGFHYILQVAILSIVIGGALAILMLIRQGQLVQFLKRMYSFLLSVFVSELEVLVPKIDKNLKMPFGVAISIAAVWCAFGNPSQYVDLMPW